MLSRLLIHLEQMCFDRAVSLFQLKRLLSFILFNRLKDDPHLSTLYIDK